MAKIIKNFSLKHGHKISNCYTVIGYLGGGYEGEVYKVIESHTNKVRAIKLYYPQRNVKFKRSVRYAKKLDKLADSNILMNYLSHEIVRVKDQNVACLLSEFIEGELLGDFIKKQRGQRLGIFPAIHLLYSIVKGVEAIHLKREYHGDLHVGNIFIRRFGLEFDLKIIDLYHWEDSKQANREEDILNVIRVFYDILGGAKHYKKLPPSIKEIICGLKSSLILKKFKTISSLRVYIESMDWSDAV